MWGLPLQFHFVGLWLAVHRVRDPTVFSARGSVGGSTKAQLGPVLSCGGCWPAGRRAGSRPASPRMPTQHARPGRQRRRGREAGHGGKGCQGPPGAPTQGGSGCCCRKDGVHLPVSSRAIFQGLLAPGSPAWLPLSCSVALSTQWRLIVLVCLCF